MASQASGLMEKLTALCKRRGFIFQSSEIYGGIGGFWDYGPLGVELKRNIKNAWWEDYVVSRDDMVGLDCSIIMNPRVWEASGHVGGFSDPMIDCKGCKARFRADKIFFIHVIKQAPAEMVAGLGDNAEVILASAVEADDPAGAAEAAERAIQAAAKSANVGFLKKCSVADANISEVSAVLTVEGKGDQPVYALIQPVKAFDSLAQQVCPRCGAVSLTEPREFNLMFQTYVGALLDEDAKAYLRPETAQGIFANFKNVLDTSRMKLPFGIAQIGKSFRNEINPRNYTFRSREFEQMEIEFFCPPDQADQWYTYWRDERFNWYIKHGLQSSKLRLREHDPAELAHYSKATADIEYEFPFGVSELEGVANRTDFDLSQHQKFSGKDLSYFDDETKERFVPYVIEPSGGCDRATLAMLCEAYTEDEAPDDKGNMQTRTVMKLHPRLAPTKVAVFPLVRKEGMPEVAQGIHKACQQAGLTSFYDEKGAVGRRYRRQDEAGTPFCVTVDGQTLEDQTVTVRNRDTLEQQRVSTDSVAKFVRENLAAMLPKQ